MRTKLSILDQLEAVDSRVIDAGWHRCSAMLISGDEIRQKFFTEFRQFLNRWTDISSEYCQRLNVSDSPLSTK